MKIGIIGSGNQGTHLGLAWAEQGHEVLFGARNPAQAERSAGLSRNGARAGTNQEAAEFADVLVYSPREVDPAEVLDDVSALDGKVVICPNNSAMAENFDWDPIEISIAEKLQAQLPNARVVKGFNTMAALVIELGPKPLDELGVSVYVAGDDAEARGVVARLAQDIGFQPVDCGELKKARLIEGLGDFIRFRIHTTQAFYSTINVNVLPEPGPEQAGRFGGFQPTKLP
jgi:8-hydroxy-5-deazaflavin:NADPH oxidoreductase